jgi:hypothetical protein
MRVPSRVSFGALDFSHHFGSLGQAVPPAIAPELGPLMAGSTPLTDLGDVRLYRRRFIAKGGEVAALGSSGNFPGEGETTLLLYLYGPNAGKADLVLTTEVAVGGWNLLSEDKDGAVYGLSLTVPTGPPIPADSLSSSIDLVKKAVEDAKAQVDVGSDNSYTMALKILDGGRAQSTGALFAVNIFEEMGIISSQAANAYTMLFLDLKGQIQNLYYQINSRGNLIDQFAKALLGFSAKVASVVTPIFDSDVAAAKKIFANFITLRQNTSNAIKSILALSPDLQKAPQTQNALALLNERLNTYNQVLANADRIASARGFSLKDLFGVDTQLSDLGIEAATLTLILTIIGIIISAISAFAFLYPALRGTAEQKEIQREGIILQEYIQTVREYRAKGESEALAIKHATEYIKTLGAFAPSDLEKFTAKAMPEIDKAIAEGKKAEKKEIEKVAIASGEADNAHWPILIGAAIVIGIIIYMKTRKSPQALELKPKRLAR